MLRVPFKNNLNYKLWFKWMKNSTLVYSTETGSTCPSCGKSLKKCVCQQKQVKFKNDGVIRVSRETKGRKGSGVTLISGLPLTLDQIHDLAKQLKQLCGSGGTVKDAVIEIQGEHRDKVVMELIKRGFTAKRAGG